MPFATTATLKIAFETGGPVDGIQCNQRLAVDQPTGRGRSGFGHFSVRIARQACIYTYIDGIRLLELAEV